MGHKIGRNGKTVRKFFGFLGALWLVMACLAGCTASGGGMEYGRAAEISGEIGDGRSQESVADAEDDGGSPGSSGQGEDEGREPDIKSDAGLDIESGTEPAAESSTEPIVESGTEPAVESGIEPSAESNGGAESSHNGRAEDGTAAGTIEKSGVYTSKDEVALYLHLYGCLPDNYITKRDAENLGWNSKEGNLWEVAPGMSIGGSRFGNYEGALPDKKGRKYFECDIDYEGGYRGAKRLIYSDDGLIFYTEDHYNTFEQLYGE